MPNIEIRLRSQTYHIGLTWRIALCNITQKTQDVRKTFGIIIIIILIIISFSIYDNNTIFDVFGVILS